VVAAADLESSRLLTGSNERHLYSSGIVFSRSPDDLRRRELGVTPTVLRFDGLVRPESSIVSMEILVEGLGAARSRFASGPPVMPAQRVTVSDFLLVDAPSTMTSTLEAAATYMLPRREIRRQLPISLFWEMYGLEEGDSLSVSITTERLDRSLLTTLGRAIGVVRGTGGSSVSWSEVVRAAIPIDARSVSVILSELARGRHELRIEVSVNGQIPVTARREIVLVD
jgi:hypothetical protein